MANIATVSISLVANSAKFVKSLGKAKKGARSFAKSAVADLKRVATAGLLMAAAIGGAVLRATAKQDLALAQLRQGVESTSGVAGRSAEQLQRMAESLQLVSTFGDDAIVSMQAVLLTFTQIRGDNFDRTTQSVIDLSTRMGTDLTSSALQLGKALNDPIANLGALSRAGIQFSLDQKAVIKTMVESNNLAGAQKVILRELETQFGGSAKAARDTLGGAFEALKFVMGDLLEQDDGIPAVRNAVEEMTDFIADPGTKAGFDSFFALLIEGASLAVSFAVGIGSFVTASREFLSGVSETKVGQVRIEIRETVEEIEGITKRLATAQSDVAKFGTGFIAPFSDTGPVTAVSVLDAQLTAAITKVTQLQFQLAELLKPPEAPAGDDSDVEAPTGILGLLDADTELKPLAEIFEREREMFDTRFRERLDSSTRFARKQIMKEQEMIDARMAAEIAAEMAIRQAKVVSQNLALGLIMQLGQRSKAFAIAAIAIEKALAIQRFLIQNKIAAELAFASQLIPGVPASLATAAAAKAAVLAQGKIGAALIAATGVLQLAQLTSGGGGGNTVGGDFGTPTNAVFGTPGAGPETEETLAGFEDQSRFQITINGDLIGIDEFARERMIGAIRDAIDENDMVIIGPDSTQRAILIGEIGGDG